MYINYFPNFAAEIKPIGKLKAIQDMENTFHTDNSKIVASTYTRCYEDLKRYITAYTHDVMASEDMIQNIFMKLLSMDIITESTASNLAFVIAKRMIIDDARHKAFVRRQEKDMTRSLSLYDDYSVDAQIARDEIAAFEGRILNDMAPKRAEVYKMYRHEELSAQEIADALNLSKRTVEAHIYLSTKEMRDKMRKAL